YPAEEAARAAGRALPGLVIPPGVDVDRFRPGPDDPVSDDGGARAVVRKRYGLPEAAPVVLGVSRLVPRKGFDVLIDAVARLARRSFPAAGASDEPVHLALGGSGRDRGRLAARAAGAGLGDRFHLLGRVPDEDLAAV